jgi:hypothetical protein
MNFRQVEENICNGDAVLITGAGASYGVPNREGTTLPTGDELRDRLCADLGLAADDRQLPLTQISEYYMRQKGEKALVEFLRKEFLVEKSSEAPTALYQFPWKRCYTINYDNIPSLAGLISVDDSDIANKNLESGTCIHLNGRIETLTVGKIRNMKLTSESYVTKNLLDSVWWPTLKMDLESARTIVLVGISLESDYELKKALYNRNAFKTKTIIVEKQNLSKVTKESLQDLGEVVEIGQKAFTQTVREFSKSYKKKKDSPLSYQYLCFRHNAHSDEGDANNQTALVSNMFYNGTFEEGLFSENKNEIHPEPYKLIMQRESAVTAAEYLCKDKRLIFLYSRLGNGKTGTVHLLAEELKARGIDYFIFKGEAERNLAREIDLISQISDRRCVVIIEQYHNNIDILQQFKTRRSSQVSFVLTARTAVHEQREIVVRETLSGWIDENDSASFDLDRLRENELNELDTILVSNSSWGKLYLPTREDRVSKLKSEPFSGELQSIILGIAQSGELRKRFDNLLSSIKNTLYLEPALLVLAHEVLNLEVSTEELFARFFPELQQSFAFRDDPAIKELISFDSSKMIKIHSSVVAADILRNTSDGNQLFEVLLKVAQFCDKHMGEKKYRNSLKTLVSISELRQLFKNKSFTTGISSYFESIRRLNFAQKNYFLWHQNCLAYLVTGQLDAAQNSLDQAYALTKTKKSFNTYQFDNTQAKLCFERIINKSTMNIKSDFETAHGLLINSNIDRQENLDKRMKVFNKYYFNPKIENALKSVGEEQLLENSKKEMKDWKSRFIDRKYQQQKQSRGWTNSIGSLTDPKTKQIMLKMKEASQR